jgi:cysteinyl-tRNA synthetase
LKLAYLSVHYRTPINFTEELMDTTEKNILRIRNVYQQLTELKVGEGSAINQQINRYIADFTSRFEAEMDDDFNTANAISLMYELIKRVNSFISENIIGPAEADALLNLLETILAVLGLDIILHVDKTSETATDWIEELIAARNNAKANKNWAEADRIRDLLSERGILLEDTAKGVRWRRK